ncbi:MAG TPA: hypothetical protein VFR37_04785 [Longimicrobium sp.]|nr:hypothetical protein [Longimicrobium sp.]
MLKGVELTVLIGPGVPVPAPREVVEALESVQVTSGTRQSGFQLTFAVGKTSKLLTQMLPAGYLDPVITRVILVATVRGLPHVLMDGVVTRHEVSPSSDPGRTTLTVTGEDLSLLMDLVEMPFMRYPGMPIIAVVYAILAKYAVLGIIPAAIPPIIPETDIPIKRIPGQTGTDLQHVRLLAGRCGYVFYVEPGPAPGTSIAYFGPDLRIPVPQPALSVNMDAHTNVESLSFSLDGDQKKIMVLTTFDPATNKIPLPIPVPNLSVLRPPLGARLTPPRRVEFMNNTTKLSVAAAANRALSMSFAAADAVTGNGTLDVVRYGRVLRSRMLVGVRGAGVTYDGMYYVNSVTHTLKRGEYKQSFTLSRDGVVSPTSRVPA